MYLSNTDLVSWVAVAALAVTLWRAITDRLTLKDYLFAVAIVAISVGVAVVMVGFDGRP